MSGSEIFNDPLVNNSDDEITPLINEDVSSDDSGIVVSQRPSLLPQYFTAFAACLGGFSVGCTVGYSSPAGPLLINGTDNIIHLTEEENGYFGSILTLGALFGGPLAGFLIASQGRKSTMIFSTIPFAVGWVLIASAQNFSMLMIGRLLTGLCVGGTSLMVPTYIGEFSSPSIRGTLASGYQLFVTLGALYAFMFAPFTRSFRWIAIACCIPNVVYLAFMILCKESPIYLLSKNRYQETKEALMFFRGNDYDITDEMESLKMNWERSQRNKKTIKDFKSPHILKPLSISVALMLFQQLSGINAIIFNLGLIFKASGSSIHEDISPIIVGVLQVVSTFISVVLIDRLGRRQLLIASAAIMAISLAALGFHFFEVDHDAEVASKIGWLPLASLSLYIFAFSIGYGGIPWVLMGELFSSDIREVAASVATCSNWSFAFIITILYQPLSNSLHLYGIYWLFTAATLVNVVFCLCAVVETKGKSIQEITAIFGGGSASRANADNNPALAGQRINI